MSDFANSFNAPLVETINGKTYTLPLFDVDDLAAISREILNEQKQQALSRVGVQDAVARAETAAWFDSTELDIEEMCRVVKTATGARRVMIRSFALGKNPAADFPAFIEALTAERGGRGVVTMACVISRLWPTPKRTAEGAGPNADSASGDSTADAVKAPEPTGVSTA